MPFEWIADFRPPYEATQDEILWSAFTQKFLKRLLRVEPRLRVRIRNLPQGIKSIETVRKTDTSKVVALQPVSLASDNVDPELRDRLEVPPAGEYWVRTYICQDCLDPSTGEPGMWVPHIRRLLHKDHNLVEGDITHRGIRPTWTPSHQVYSASPERLAGQIHLMYSIAVTTVPAEGDEKLLKDYDAIALFPFTSVDREKAERVAGLEDVFGRIKAVRGARMEKFLELDASPGKAVQQLLEWLQLLDRHALDVPQEEGDADEEELQEQLNREKAARATLKQAQAGVDAMGAKGALAAATSGRSSLKR